MKKIIFTSLLILSSAPCWSQGFFNDVKVTARAGYNVGGTQPVGLPASIRKLNSYHIKSNFVIGVDAEKPISSKWGVMLGLRFENKGMEIDATVKKYYMEIVKGGDSMKGYFYGDNFTRVKQWMFTVPVQAAFNPSDRVRLKFGPYVSFLTSKDFSGYAYDGYLRGNTPVGPKVDLGHEDDYQRQGEALQFPQLQGYHRHTEEQRQADIAHTDYPIHIKRLLCPHPLAVLLVTEESHDVAHDSC